MKISSPDADLEEPFAEEKNEFAEIDFSALLDFPALSPAFAPGHQNQSSDLEKYIVFHLNEKLYGIRTDKILEIAPLLPITPLPRIDEWFMGIANLRGMIISVINLRKLWKKPDFTSQKPKLIIFQAAKNDVSIAFMVDKVSEIVTVPMKDVNFSASDFEHSFPTFFGKTFFKSQPLFLLDIDKILSSLKLNSSNAQ